MRAVVRVRVQVAAVRGGKSKSRYGNFTFVDEVSLSAMR